MNSIKDCPVTVEDVDIAESIYGPDVASLKGKATRTNPTPVIRDYVDIPPELMFRQHQVDLCIDTFFVNGIPFLSSISKRIMFRTCSRITDRKMQHYRSALEEIFRMYEGNGFTIARIHADQEFKPTLTQLQDDGKMISFNLANAQEHQPHAERNNRTIQERVRAVFHSLPYQALPTTPLVYLVMEVTRRLNFFPPRGGVSQYYSPREIVTGQRLDYKRQCSIPLLSYVVAHDEPQPSNTQAARALDCLYLRPAGDSTQGGHECWHIATGRIVNRRHVTKIPVTSSVQAAVEAAAQAEGMTKLHLKSKHGVTLFDSSQIAGVDYTLDAVQNDDDPYTDPDYTYESDQDEELEADTDEESQDSSDDDDDDYQDQPASKVTNTAPITEESKQPEEQPTTTEVLGTRRSTRQSDGESGPS